MFYILYIIQLVASINAPIVAFQKQGHFQEDSPPPLLQSYHFYRFPVFSRFDRKFPLISRFPVVSFPVREMQCLAQIPLRPQQTANSNNELQKKVHWAETYLHIN